MQNYARLLRRFLSSLKDASFSSSSFCQQSGFPMEGHNYGTKCSKIRVWDAVIEGSVEIMVLSVAKLESGLLWYKVPWKL